PRRDAGRPAGRLTDRHDGPAPRRQGEVSGWSNKGCVGQNVGYAVRMARAAPVRRRPKVTTTLDPDLLAAVDAHVAAHPDLARTAVFDAALRLWRAHELERALEAQ